MHYQVKPFFYQRIQDLAQAHYLNKAKKKCMFAVTRPSQLKSNDPKLFLPESTKDYQRLFHKLLCTFKYNIFLYLSIKKAEL